MGARVNVICFQEVSLAWYHFLAKECLEGWFVTREVATCVVTAVHKPMVDMEQDVPYQTWTANCFTEPGDNKNKHRYWRKALMFRFQCPESRRTVVIANLHIISGEYDTQLRSSVVPGNSPEARERFKITALRNILMRVDEDLIGVRPAPAKSQGEPGIMIVAGDMNLSLAAVNTALPEATTLLQHPYIGRSVSGNRGRMPPQIWEAATP